MGSLKIYPKNKLSVGDNCACDFLTDDKSDNTRNDKMQAIRDMDLKLLTARR